MARKIEVLITADATQAEQEFDRAGQAARRYGNETQTATDKELRGITKVAAGRKSFGAFRAGATIVGSGFLAARTLQGTGAAIGQIAGETNQFATALGDAGDAAMALTTLDIAGFISAVGASSRRTRDSLDQYAAGITDVNSAEKDLQLAEAAAAMGFDKQAQAIRDQVQAAKLAKATTDALDFSQRQFNQTVIDGTNYLVAYKGAHDAAMNPTAQPQIYGGATADPRKRLPTQGLFLSPSERRENELIALQGTARVPLLRDRIKDLTAQREGVKLHANYARISNEIASTEAEIAAIKTSQNASDKAAAAAAAAEADRLRRDAAERARIQREAATAAEQRRQFQLIGLSPEGDQPTPTAANLRRQREQLQARLAGGETLPADLRRRWATVSKAVTGGIRDMKEPTRSAINDYFRTVRDALNQGDENLKPFATAGLNTNRIVSGLGLTARQARALRARLAGSTTAGRMLSPEGVGAYGMPINTTVYLDGQVVGRSTKRYLSKDSLRAPMQKRGPHAGRG